MVLAVIVSESIENGNVWKELSENLLNLDVVFLELFVLSFCFWCALILYVSSHFVGNQITCEKDIVDRLFFIDLVEEFGNVFHQLW